MAALCSLPMNHRYEDQSEAEDGDSDGDRGEGKDEDGEWDREEITGGTETSPSSEAGD